MQNAQHDGRAHEAQRGERTDSGDHTGDEAGHHAMLDEPLILLTAIRTLLADWDHSDPHRR